MTFTRVTPGLYDPETGHSAEPTTVTIEGSAIQVRGDPEKYRLLGLIESAAPTFFFSPADYELRAFTDDFVQPGDTTVWNGRTFTVRDVVTIAPDGIVIAARIVAAV